VPSVFFYISGHGFGHASRQIAVINALVPRLRDHEIVIRTSAARWLFEHGIRGACTYLAGDCDTGIVQIDSLRLDARETIARADEFTRRLPEHAAREARLLRERGARLVIADAPPLGCAAAVAAGVPSVVLSNFTWDWIYEEYADALSSAPALVPAIREAYGAAEEAWRLPLGGGFRTFDRIVDVPFAARHAEHDRATVRARLHLPADRPVVLSSFGGYGVSDFDAGLLDCLDEWAVVVTGREKPPAPPAGVHFLHEPAIYDAGLHYEDLVGAADAVATKPGYGIVAECLANDTAMLYTSRGRFAEYDVMVAEMPQFIRCEFVPQDDMLAGRWREPLARLMGRPEPPVHPRTDGAEVVAQMIVECLAASRDGR
jgi:hypothetical protein